MTSTLPPASALRCEYLVSPLGIDVPSPRLTWVVTHPRRGGELVSYRIAVASNPGLASAGQGDVWDSGIVESRHAFSARYSGPPLRSRTRYFWSVAWWDDRGEAGPVSPVAWFETGLLENTDWRATWITRGDWPEFRSNGSVMTGQAVPGYRNVLGMYLRREFSVPSAPRSARLYVSGLGFGVISLNGVRIGDAVLDPAQTDYRSRALYSTYDVTGLLDTRNCIGVILGNGRHITSYGYGNPRLFLQLEADGSPLVWTDGAWKCSTGPIRENGVYFGERYDARLEMPGWDAPGFKTSGWREVESTIAPPPTSQLMPPIRVVETLPARRITAGATGASVVDFGRNFAGWVRLRVRGPRGTEVRLRFAELLHEDGTVNTAPNVNAEATDVYVLKGEGVEVYEPSFTYHGFRYVEVFGYPGIPGEGDIVGCVVHTDVEQVGTFTCSLDLVNRIHDCVVWAQRSNLMSIPTDCPQRDERYGWMGDAALSAPEAVLNFDMAAFYTKFLADIRAAQRPDGSLPDTVPPYPGDRMYPADPAWGTAYITIAWHMYMAYGDTGILEEHFPAMFRYVEFLKSSGDGHIQRSLGKYGDWCPPGSVAPKKAPVELTSTWFAYHDVVHLARIAVVLGRSRESAGLLALADEIAVAFNREFLTEQGYRMIRLGPVDFTPSQTSNVLPLALSMVPADRAAEIFGTLVKGVVTSADRHLDTGILGARYLLDVLADHGHADLAFRILTQTSYPGWGYMVSEGATTLWERWEKLGGDGMNSQNHIMFGTCDPWLYERIAGITCTGPSWSSMRVQPPAFGGVTHASATVRTIRGEAAVRWQRNDARIDLELRVPAEALVVLPIPAESARVSENGTLVFERGEAAGTSEGIRRTGTDHGFPSFAVGSGEYRFRAEVVGPPATVTSNSGMRRQR